MYTRVNLPMHGCDFVLNFNYSDSVNANSTSCKDHYHIAEIKPICVHIDSTLMHIINNLRKYTRLQQLVHVVFAIGLTF